MLVKSADLVILDLYALSQKQNCIERLNRLICEPLPCEIESVFDALDLSLCKLSSFLAFAEIEKRRACSEVFIIIVHGKETEISETGEAKCGHGTNPCIIQ